MTLPINRSYTAEHEWLEINGGIATVGITEYAVDALGDIVFVDLPAVGATVDAGETCGEIESVKSVSDLFAPASGEVIEVNDTLADDPAVINLDPFGRGWLFKLRLTGNPDLLDAAAYAELIEAGS